MQSEAQQIASVFGLWEVGSVELLIVGTVTPLDAAIASLASERITAQVSIQWVEVVDIALREAARWLGDSGWIITAGLLTPVGLKSDLDLQAVCP